MKNSSLYSTTHSRVFPIGMHVDTYIPPPRHPLRPYLQSIWCVKARGDFSRETILPKGNVDILFNLGSGIICNGLKGENQCSLTPAPYLAGLQTRSFQNSPVDDVHLMGISLNASTCSAVITVPLSELTDIFLDATLLFKDAGELIDRIYSARSFRERCDLLIRWLTKQVTADPRAESIRKVCGTLCTLPTEAVLNGILSDLDISSRHLHRLFMKHVGAGPSHFLRLSRFSQSLRLMTGPSSLTEIAHAVHYFDQAHFSRDFRAIAGMTPREYRSLAGYVPGHLFSL